MNVIRETESGYFTLTINGKTYYRARRSNLETIQNMHRQGMDISRIPDKRVEFITTHEEQTLATGKVIDVVTKTPSHPDADYGHVWTPYSYVPEYGKGYEAVVKRAEQAHAADYEQYGDKWYDTLLSGGLPSFKLPDWKLPDFGLPGLGWMKYLIPIVLILIVGVVLMVALGYSGLGPAAGSHMMKK